MAKTVVHQDLKSMFGDEDLLEVAQSRSFSCMIFELLSEKKPNPEEEKIFELCLNLSIDHGSETPSAIKTTEEAKSGATISEAVAAGIKEISDTHGGAIEPAMNFFYQLDDHILHDRSEVIKNLVKEYLDEHKLIGGFGHRLYKDTDPRAELILNKLKESGLGSEYIDLATQVKDAINDYKQKTLPLNVDGAIAVVLCTFGWSPKLGKAVFIIARTPGLCGQYLNSLPK